MNPRQSTGFTMKPEGNYVIYMTRADNREIPAGEQRIVYSNSNMTRAQAVCDALNNGLLFTIGTVVRDLRAATAGKGRAKK